MADVLFLLGAGASKEGGAPLMAEFLETARRLMDDGEVEGHRAAFERVMDGMSALRAVHSHCDDLDIDNVESVFAAFEMAQTLAKFPGYEPAEIGEFSKAMKVVIYRTIEKSMTYPVRGTWESGQHVVSPEPYDSFLDLVLHIIRETRVSQRVAILTFNYDVAVDYAFRTHGLSPDYFLQPKDAPEGVPLLKLHGSINWAHCPECDAVVPWKIKDFFSGGREWPLYRELKGVYFDIASKLQEMPCHCEGVPVDPEPVVIPPTWNKEDYYRQVRPVWAQAAKQLGEAHSIFVIGYSYPDSDAFFRYLYALGAVDAPVLKRFWVVNPEPEGGRVDQRFRRLLGPGAIRRYTYVAQPFSQALRSIKDEFPAR